MVGSTNGSEQTISIFTFSWNSATIVLPRYCSTTSRSPPWPVTRLKVMPVTPARNNAALTSGSRSGRMMVVIRRIARLLVLEKLFGRIPTRLLDGGSSHRSAPAATRLERRYQRHSWRVASAPSADFRPRKYETPASGRGAGAGAPGQYT